MSSKRMRTRKSQQLSDYEMETFLSTATLLNRCDLLVVQRAANLKVSQISNDFSYVDLSHPEILIWKPITKPPDPSEISILPEKLKETLFFNADKMQLKYRLEINNIKSFLDVYVLSKLLTWNEISLIHQKSLDY